MEMISFIKITLDNIYSSISNEFIDNSMEKFVLKNLNNTKLLSKLDISLYTYQKKYFEQIITPALLYNTEILLQNNIFDKKTLNKLKSDWDNETT